MNTNTIFQFECFETNVLLEEFVLRWEHYAKRFVNKNAEVTLHQSNAKNKFKYISQHERPEDTFQFTFMNDRYSENFPECDVKVIQAGGYSVLQMQCLHDNDPNDVKIILFAKNETDVRSYKQIPRYLYLNIYQSYFESCLFSYILEFYVEEIRVDDFIKWIKTLPAESEAGIYKECLVLHA